MGIFHEDRDRVVVAVERDKTLWQLINEFLAAYRIRTEAWRSDDGADSHTLQAILTTVQNLDRKVDIMSSNIDRIEKEAADLAEDVTQVQTALDGLKASQSELQALVTDLRAQVAQGQVDQARLDAAAAKLEKVDDDLDAITLPGTPPVEPPAEG